MSIEQTSTGSDDAADRDVIGVDSESTEPITTAAVASEHESPREDDADEEDTHAVFYEDQVQPEYGILGFTLRELIIVGAWALAFIVSFFPVLAHGASVWSSGIDWILTIGVPTAAVFLLVLRRLSPEGIRRVGSLGIDQFASVAAVVAGVAWAQLLWRQVAVSIDTDAFLVGWVPIVAEVATLALIAATVIAPVIPHLRDDFEGRMETLAHRNADPVRPVIRRPRPAAAVVSEDAQEDAETVPDADAASEPVESDDDATHVIDLSPASDAPRDGQGDATSAAAIVPMPREAGTAYTDPIGALHDIFRSDDSGVEPGDTGEQVDAPLRRDRNDYARDAASAQPFWILANTQRDVLDERGLPLYRIGPSAWTLVIEDRDGAYVVRHDDGRIGYLHDLTDITKG